MNHFIDHAATTPLDAQILQSIAQRCATPANASSVHRFGQDARALLEDCRARVAQQVGAAADEVLFLSSATEANNLALRGFFTQKQSPRVLITSALEHACVRQTAQHLARLGLAEVLWLPVSPAGQAVLDGAPGGAMLALMAVQNETGIRQQLAEARAWRAANPVALWLCDVTQALASEPIRVSDLGADLISFSSHKLYGPPGVGALVGPGIKRLRPQLTGGPQERELRAGTQPVALIEGFTLAVEATIAQRESHVAHLIALSDAFYARLSELGVPWRDNGDPQLRAPGFINLSIPGLAGDDAVIGLDARGYSISSGAACATGVMEPSPALLAMFPDDAARAAGAIRITPGRGTTVAVMVGLAEALATLSSSRR